MKVAAIGECMMELRDAGNCLYALGYGGDTFNTAVYLRRLGIPAAYVTALGDDPFSGEIVDLCRDEGVDIDLIAHVGGQVPGLYLIKTDATGERSFYYWRHTSPARRLFELPTARELVERLQNFDVIYLSGITLSLYSERGREVLFEAIDRARRNGCRVCFDGNYRPRGWSDGDAARSVFNAMLERVDIVLPTLDDERSLFGDADAQATVRRYLAAGVEEIVVKDGHRGCVVGNSRGMRLIAVETVVVPVDTTAAGDSFNAGYLAARLLGAPAEEAVRTAQRLAAVVIRHRGAIIAKEVMPPLDHLFGNKASVGDRNDR